MTSLLAKVFLTQLKLPYRNVLKPVDFQSSTVAAFLRFKHQQLDYSLYPKLNEDELEETFTRGSGPGGQAVNKTSNCVLLRHIPTNILVKCHTHRLASKNRVEARRLLLEKLDVHLNGEQSIQEQLKLMEGKKSAERKRRQNKLQDLKQKWKEREEQEATDSKKE